MAADQPRSAHATPAPFADSVPSLVENAPVSLDVLSQRLEREMWRRERQVQVERVVTVLAGMALQPVDGMAGDRRSGIEAVALLRRRKPLIVQQMPGFALRPDAFRGWGPARHLRARDPGGREGLVGLIGAMTDNFCD